MALGRHSWWTEPRSPLSGSQTLPASRVLPQGLSVASPRLIPGLSSLGKNSWLPQLHFITSPLHPCTGNCEPNSCGHHETCRKQSGVEQRGLSTREVPLGSLCFRLLQEVPLVNKLPVLMGGVAASQWPWSLFPEAVRSQSTVERISVILSLTKYR